MSGSWSSVTSPKYPSTKCQDRSQQEGQNEAPEDQEQVRVVQVGGPAVALEGMEGGMEVHLGLLSPASESDRPKYGLRVPVAHGYFL